ncbi:MAG: hypothetical protein Ta2E_10140 [Mycoplasmoidaceae bacterium]|nr:MAG: hypothetical protein Ta2E_10140 [Mycoplasmoidaceae bacterium]
MCFRVWTGIPGRLKGSRQEHVFKRTNNLGIEEEFLKEEYSSLKDLLMMKATARKVARQCYQTAILKVTKWIGFRGLKTKVLNPKTYSIFKRILRQVRFSQSLQYCLFLGSMSYQIFSKDKEGIWIKKMMSS